MARARLGELGSDVVEDHEGPCYPAATTHWPSALRADKGKGQINCPGNCCSPHPDFSGTALVSPGILSSVKRASARSNFSLSVLLSLFSRASSPQCQWQYAKLPKVRVQFGVGLSA